MGEVSGDRDHCGNASRIVAMSRLDVRHGVIVVRSRHAAGRFPVAQREAVTRAFAAPVRGVIVPDRYASSTATAYSTPSRGHLPDPRALARYRPEFQSRRSHRPQLPMFCPEPRPSRSCAPRRDLRRAGTRSGYRTFVSAEKPRAQNDSTAVSISPAFHQDAFATVHPPKSSAADTKAVLTRTTTSYRARTFSARPESPRLTAEGFSG